MKDNIAASAEVRVHEGLGKTQRCESRIIKLHLIMFKGGVEKEIT